MFRVTLIDTSILLNLLSVPGRSQDHEAVRQEMRVRRSSGEQFILPITTVVETGNHIAQIKDSSRRNVAEKFTVLLEQCLKGKAPFRFDKILWNREFLQSFVAGAGTSTPLVDHLDRKLGAGDLCILTELALRREKLGNTTEVGVWTLDDQPSSYS